MKSREQYIRDSIEKWGPHIWDMMKTALDDTGLSDKHRWYMFKKTLWHMCGFCFIYKGRSSCFRCPLHMNYCMPDPVDCYDSSNVISKIMHAWENDDKETFHKHRRELVRKMASCLIEGGT